MTINDFLVIDKALYNDNLEKIVTHQIKKELESMIKELENTPSPPSPFDKILINLYKDLLKKDSLVDISIEKK